MCLRQAKGVKIVFLAGKVEIVANSGKEFARVW